MSAGTKQKGFIGIKTGIVIFTILIISILFWKPIFHSSVSVVCASFVTESNVNGVDVYVFEYKTKNGDKYKIHESENHFKIKSDSLYKFDCIKLEYSNILNLSGEIVDERVKENN